MLGRTMPKNQADFFLPRSQNLGHMPTAQSFAWDQSNVSKTPLSSPRDSYAQKLSSGNQIEEIHDPQAMCAA